MSDVLYYLRMTIYWGAKWLWAELVYLAGFGR